MIKRTIQKEIHKAIQMYPVTIITGARQVGKSTESYRLVEEFGYNYVSLDNLMARELASTDPYLFFQQYQTPLIIDEIQYVPVLFEVIEEMVNRERLAKGDANGMFVLTGSQKYSMMKNVSQSLAGRATILQMLPLSQDEISNVEEKAFLPNKELLNSKRRLIKIDELFKNIIRGFYPELHRNRDLDANIFYNDYVQTYIDRDINEIINVKHKITFHNFMQYIATMTSCQLNYSTISKHLNIDQKTVKAWISALEVSGIVYLLQPYNENLPSKRVVKSPKLYFYDTGLAAFLARIYDAENLMVSNQAGAFMENYVINEIMKSYINNRKIFNAFYYRDTNQNEVDLIIQENGANYFIEIKKGVKFNKHDVKAFKLFEKSMYKNGPSCIICNTLENYIIDENVFVFNVNVI